MKERTLISASRYSCFSNWKMSGTKILHPFLFNKLKTQRISLFFKVLFQVVQAGTMCLAIELGTCLYFLCHFFNFSHWIKKCHRPDKEYGWAQRFAWGAFCSTVVSITCPVDWLGEFIIDVTGRKNKMKKK